MAKTITFTDEQFEAMRTMMYLGGVMLACAARDESFDMSQDELLQLEARIPDGVPTQLFELLYPEGLPKGATH